MDNDGSAEAGAGVIVDPPHAASVNANVKAASRSPYQRSVEALIGALDVVTMAGRPR